MGLPPSCSSPHCRFPFSPLPPSSLARVSLGGSSGLRCGFSNPSAGASPRTPVPAAAVSAPAPRLVTGLAADSYRRNQKKKEKGYGGSLPAILRALDGSDERRAVHEALDPFAGKLSPKELTVLLREQRDWRRVVQVFQWMRSQGEQYVPNPIHYNVVLRALGRAREWDKLRLCWIDMARDGVLPTNNTYGILVDVFGKAGLVKEALLWLRHMRSRGVFPDEVTMNTVLRILKDSGQFDHGDKFFNDWCSGRVDLQSLDFESDGEPDMGPLSPRHFLLTEMLRSGGRAPMSEIRSAVEEGSRKPRLAATFNTLIDLYGKAGRLKEASDAFADMLRRGIPPDTTTFNTMIHVCGSHGLLSEAEALLVKMEERRIRPDTKTFNIFMSLYASEGNVEAVMLYYRKIRDSGLKADTVTYRIVLLALCERRMVQEVEGVIGEMKEADECVDEQSIPLVIEMYVEEGLVERAKVFFRDHCLTRQIPSKNYAAIIDVYAEKGLWMEAEDVFYAKRASGHRETVEYNVMIKAYGKAKLYEKALSLFERMASSGAWPDECTYNSIIQMLSVGDLPDRASGLLIKMQEAGMRPRCETFSAVIASSGRAGMLDRAENIFQEMKQLGVLPNEVVYGSLIDTFAESGNVEKALHYFHMMESLRLPVNKIVLTSLIKAHSKMGQWKEAQEVYTKVKELADGPDVVASNCMIDLYAHLGMVSEARALFAGLRSNGQANAVSYAIMMYLYKNMGMLGEAIDVAKEMQQAGLLSDCASFNNVMASYATNGQLRECGELLHQMLIQEILPDVATYKIILTVLKKGAISSEAVSQLESAYTAGKCFSREALVTSMFSTVGLHAFALESCETFITAEHALDLFAYNVAISVFASSGETGKALNLFMRMQDERLRPDIVTYINLAGCYGKAGFVEGLKRLYSKLKYGEIESNESLFKAVVDACRESGRLDLAQLVDQEMRFSLSADTESYQTDLSEQSESETDESSAIL
ncbi:hypothetical protein Taro_016203 [Colocasia esculenta]|uniref:PROP1-like PPR domain-containing protein n=1 Tax=Colocasia esculenta TaxID=4460 RepID=A0A843UK12_COLES|nr:hypothetical protein [Colocasia esculenta]